MLGRGGMGEVYRADDLKLQQPLALKFLPPALADQPRVLDALLNEVRQARRVSHPHVCRVHDIGDIEGQPFLSMEFIEGEDLASLLRRIGQLPVNKAVQLGQQLVSGLAAAHRQGVLHLDLKPANVMIDERGDLRVADFGLARLSTRRETATQRAGTPAYMAPEQLQDGTVSARTDIYAIGLILGEMLTGRRPSAGASLKETVQGALASLVDQMLAVRPDDRPETVEEIMAALQALGESSLKPPVSKRDDPSTVDVDEIKDSDVFINYAMVDDSPLTPGKDGWISRFHRNLSVRLEQLYGEPVNVSRAPTNDEESKIIPYVSNMKAMVPVVSPPFMKSDHCCKLVEAFSAAGANALDSISIGSGRGRMLKVVKTPVPPQQIPPRLGELFSRLLEYNFFDHDETGRIREFDEAFGEQAVQQYYERMYDLAYEICNVLRDFKPDEEGADRGKKVFLAETTSDLHAARDRLRRELIECGHTVLPDQGLPVIATKLEEEIQHFLNQSDLSIHLIGEHYGLVPEGTEESLGVLQNRLAARKSAENGLERIVWMPRGIQPGDARQAEFVQRMIENPDVHRGAEVLEDTLENLKEFLEDKWREEAKKALQGAMEGTASAGASGSEAPRVYIVCDPRDEEAVEPLEDYFFDQGIEVSLPEFGPEESQVAETHWKLLAECDAVLVYYGHAGKAWVDIKLREVVKAAGYRDGRAIDHQIVYVGPPPDRRKQRFRSLTAPVVRQEGDAFESSVLEEWVGQVKQSKSAAGGQAS